MADPQSFRPRPRRVVLAFLVAPLAASAAPFLAFAMIDLIGDPLHYVAREHESIVGDTLFIALVGAYPITIVFGLPLFLLLYGRVGFGPVPPILAGFAIVTAGVAALQGLDHHVTADGYAFAGKTGLLGAFGGWVFWIVAVWRDPRH